MEINIQNLALEQTEVRLIKLTRDSQIENVDGIFTISNDDSEYSINLAPYKPALSHAGMIIMDNPNTAVDITIDGSLIGTYDSMDALMNNLGIDSEYTLSILELVDYVPGIFSN